MDLWMQIALAGLAVVAAIIFIPRLGPALRESPKGSARDWLGLLLPIGGVVLFVILLVMLARA